MTVLVTGAAGFVGAAVTEVLLRRGDSVVGLDNLNDYYDPALKRARLRRLQRLPVSDQGRGFRFRELTLEGGSALEGRAWLGKIDCRVQQDGDLGERMWAAVKQAFADGARRVVVASELVKGVMAQAHLVNVPRPDATLAAIATASAGR